MAEPAPPAAPLVSHGDDDLGAAVVVVTISLAIITLCFILLRFYSTARRGRGFGWNDATLLIALIAFIPQTAMVERAVAFGLGERMSALEESSISKFFKFIYAANILSIVVQFFAKISVLLLVSRINPEALRRKLVVGLAITIVLWAIFSIFTIAFQCGIPRPWEFADGECAADGRLTYVVIVFNILTDAGLAFFFVPTIWKLQMSKSTRKVIIALFASRFAVCAASIAHAAVLERFITSEDRSWTITPFTILGQVVVNLSLITAAIPSTHRYFASLQTGKMGLTLRPQEIELATSGYGSNNWSYFRSKAGRSKLSSAGHDQQLSHQASEKGLKLRPEMQAQQMAYVSTKSGLGGTSSQPENVGTGSAVPRRGSGATNEDDVPPEDKSTSSLKKNVVYQKREFFLDVEYKEGQDDDVQKQPTTPPAARKSIL